MDTADEEFEAAVHEEYQAGSYYYTNTIYITHFV